MATQSHFRCTRESTWEDIPSLKKYLGSITPLLNIQTIKVHPPLVATGGSAADIEFAEKTGTKISLIGKTHIAVEIALDADDNDYIGVIFTFIYKTNAGIETTLSVVGTGTMLATSLAFDPVITDMYEAIGLTCSIPMKAGDIAFVHTTADEATVWATIQEDQTVAAPVDLFGVGTLYGKYSTDNSTHDDETDVAVLDYMAPWGEKIEGATLSTGADSGASGVRFIKANGTDYVNDFYRVRELDLRVTPHGGHTFLLGDVAITNVDGSGNDVWGMVEQGFLMSIHTRHFVSRYNIDGVRTFLCGFTNAQYDVTAEEATVKVTYTPKGGVEVEYHTDPIHGTTKVVVNETHMTIDWLPEPIELEPATDCFIEVYDDNATGGNIHIQDFIIMESEPRVKRV